MTQSKAKQISKSEVSQVLSAGLTQQDVARVNGLQNLKRLRVKKSKLQSREEIRLQKKHGLKHPRTQQMDNKLDANTQYVNGLNMEAARAASPAEKCPSDVWAVKGRIYDRSGCPMENATVALYHANGERVEQIPPVKSDNQGRYLIQHKTQVGQAGDGSSQPDGSASDSTVGANATEDNIATNTGGAQGAANINTTINTNINTTNAERLNTGLRINRNIANEQKVFVRATDAENDSICSDSTLITPAVGKCNYRDLILNKDQIAPFQTLKADRRSTRFLGNSSTRELHDLQNEKSGCQIDSIRPDHCISFNSEAEAMALGYDYCGHCFGRDRSKR